MGFETFITACSIFCPQTIMIGSLWDLKREKGRVSAQLTNAIMIGSLWDLKLFPMPSSIMIDSNYHDRFPMGFET